MWLIVFSSNYPEDGPQCLRAHGKPQPVTTKTWSQQMHLCKPCRWHAVIVFAFQRVSELCYIFENVSDFCTGLLAVSATAVSFVAGRLLGCSEQTELSSVQRTLDMFAEGWDWGCAGLCFCFCVGQSVSSSRRISVFLIYITFACCCESVTFCFIYNCVFK